MSTTFAPSYDESDVLGYRYICALDESVVAEQAGGGDVSPVLRGRATLHMNSCTECRYCGSPIFESITEAPELNVTGSNSYYLQELLGLVPDECGELAAEDFLGRVLLAQGLNPADAGVPWVEDVEKSNFIYCGRRPGYADDRLIELAKIAQWALDHGRGVQWA